MYVSKKGQEIRKRGVERFNGRRLYPHVSMIILNPRFKIYSSELLDICYSDCELTLDLILPWKQYGGRRFK
jgi:hypothetical protein